MNAPFIQNVGASNDEPQQPAIINVNPLTGAMLVESSAPTSGTAGTAAAVAAVDAAPDRTITNTWEAGVSGQRVSSYVVSSASLALSYTETFTYVGGTDDIATQTRS